MCVSLNYPLAFGLIAIKSSTTYLFRFIVKLLFFVIDIAINDPVHEVETIFYPRCEKTGLRGFRPGPTQTGLYSYSRWLEARNFVFR